MEELDPRDPTLAIRGRRLPEFIPFVAPCLCSPAKIRTHGELFGKTSFFEFPAANGVTFHHKPDLGSSRDRRDYYAMAPIDELEKLPKVPPEVVEDFPNFLTDFQMCRIDAEGDFRPATYKEQVRFLQEWLFFGLLLEVSRLCGLELDVEKEFLVETIDKTGHRQLNVTTAGLTELPGRLVESAKAAATADATAALSISKSSPPKLAEAEVTNKSGKKSGNKKSSRHHEPPGDRTENFYENLAIKICSILGFIESLRIRKDEYDPLGPITFDELSVLFSVKIMLRAIFVGMRNFPIYPQFVSTRELNMLAWDLDLLPFTGITVDVEEPLRAELVRRGYCPSEAAMLFAHADFREHIFYAAFIDREKFDHSRCSVLRCFAHDTNETTYETSHVSRACSCAHVTVDVEKVVAILRKNEIPVVSISENFELSVVSSRERPYVAISHVWSHGLGNPVQNSLPLCQIKRLRNHVARLYERYPELSGATGAGNGNDGSLTLWIDSLCIPVGSHWKEYRSKAITLLGTTFTNTKVLVVDKELEAVDTQNITKMERNLRILCSVWVRRLWTLQESLLSRDLFIQFKNEAMKWIRPEAAKDGELTYGSDSDLREFVRWGTLPAFQDTVDRHVPFASTLRLTPKAVKSLLHSTSLWKTQHARLVRVVRYRTTSKMEDEPLILATMMGMDVKKLLDAKVNKMAQFYIQMGDVPGDLAFLDLEGKSLQNAPFRWAPSTLMGSEVLHSINEENGYWPARCDKRGLHIECFAHFFDGKSMARLRRRPAFTSEKITFDQDGYPSRHFEFRIPKCKTSMKWPRNPVVLVDTLRHDKRVILVDILKLGWLQEMTGYDENGELGYFDSVYSCKDDQSGKKDEAVVVVVAYGEKVQDGTGVENHTFTGLRYSGKWVIT